MTTNQTIDGVPRELIEKAMIACFEAGHGITHDRLRALLEAPAAPSKFVGAAQYWIESEQVLRDVCRFEGLKGLVYQVVRDCAKPAAKPQGEPVEIGYIEHSREFESEFAPVINRLIWTMPPDQRHKIPQRYKVMLYAEQPAPVAVADTRTTFEIEHDAEPGDEAAFRKWRQNRVDAAKKDPRTAMGV